MAEPTLAERVDGSPRLRRWQGLARSISASLGQVQLEGLHAVPDAGPVLLAVNHRSLLDGPLLFGAVADK
jgi:1-acyl-sn-glycerol-3-phosphate acyltransferase